MKKTTYSVLMTLGCIVFFYAQKTTKDSLDKKNVINLNDVIIEGDFYIDPSFVTSINNQTKQPVQPKNIADLFRSIDGVNFIKRGNYALDPSYRASQYEQLNIQYDGGVKAMHACPNRMDPVTTHVLPEEIDKIELIKGPYSVRYGANFGGVINMVTSRHRKHHGFSGNVKAGYESNGNTWLSSMGLHYMGDKIHLEGNVGHRDFGNYKDGNGTVIPSSFKSTDYAIGAGYSPDRYNHIMLNWRQSFGRDVMHAGLPMDTKTDDSSIFSVDYSINNLSGILNQFVIKGYYSTVDHLMTNDLRPNFKMMEMASRVFADTYGGKAEMKWNLNSKFNLFTGIDMFNVKRDGKKTMLMKKGMKDMAMKKPMKMEGDIWQEAYVNDLGFFVEGNYKISSKLALKSGSRVDVVKSKPNKLAMKFKKLYGDVKEKSDINFSGHLGLKYSINPKEIIEFAFGRGTRSADMTERYINYFNVGQDNFSYVGNPNLKPEINHQLELGYKNELNPLDMFKLNYGASVYYSMLSDYIVAVVEPNFSDKKNKNVKTFVNIENAYKTGFELFANAKFTHNLDLNTSLSYVYARNEELDESLPMIPPFTANFDLTYTENKIASTLRLKAVSTQKQIAKSFAEIETPGYGIMDFELTYKPLSSLSIGGAVLNIFDKTYHNHQNFSFINQANFSRVPINEAGRNITFFTRYNF